MSQITALLLAAEMLEQRSKVAAYATTLLQPSVIVHKRKIETNNHNNKNIYSDRTIRRKANIRLY